MDQLSQSNARRFWENYYSFKGGDSPLVETTSSFFEYCQLFTKQMNIESVLEYGSGNGRDARGFCAFVEKYVGVDSCPEATKVCSSLELEKCTFVTCSFASTNLVEKVGSDFDCVYSRFSLHSISQEEEDIAISNAKRILKPGGGFFIEARSTKDPRYGKGRKVSKHAFIDSHYRRFIDITSLIESLVKAGFTLQSACEEYIAARIPEDDAVVVRVICHKN